VSDDQLQLCRGESREGRSGRDGIVPLMLQRDYTVSMPGYLSFAAKPAARPCTLPALFVGSLLGVRVIHRLGVRWTKPRLTGHSTQEGAR
jgi:hypothetical protein